MINIIHNPTYEVLCDRCHTRFQYQYEDIKSTSQSRAVKNKIECPTCNNLLDHSFKNEIPTDQPKDDDDPTDYNPSWCDYSF